MCIYLAVYDSDPQSHMGIVIRLSTHDTLMTLSGVAEALPQAISLVG